LKAFRNGVEKCEKLMIEISEVIIRSKQ